MYTVAVKNNPRLWEKSKQQAVERLGGKWSARAAQLAVSIYKKAGGGYVGPKRTDNSLHIWTREKWGTRSGRPSGETGERYLPEYVRRKLSPREYELTTQKKREDTRRGKQWSPQPGKIREKTARLRIRNAKRIVARSPSPRRRR